MNITWFHVGAVGLLVLAAGNAWAAPDGEALFKSNCASCHGPDGRAQNTMGRKLGVKDLTLSQLGDADIAKQIREGKFDAEGRQRMPAFLERLSPADIAAVVQYTKSLRPDGEKKSGGQ